MSAVSMMSLTAIGTPCSGPCGGSRSRAIAASRARFDVEMHPRADRGLASLDARKACFDEIARAQRARPNGGRGLDDAPLVCRTLAHRASRTTERTLEDREWRSIETACEAAAQARLVQHAEAHDRCLPRLDDAPRGNDHPRPR